MIEMNPLILDTVEACATAGFESKRKLDCPTCISDTELSLLLMHVEVYETRGLRKIVDETPSQLWTRPSACNNMPPTSPSPAPALRQNHRLQEFSTCPRLLLIV